ncbi:hypothetical protein IWQ60_004203 [Tieghemiomyces parasiticus]|uniref:SYO1-like TPR repeats domain-containing protein n=1 Tax=Tieghemiomyces parasiticus TaxID=78921 RepID=A0A9W8A9C0_9FUNG|nr:hypothetical protein IWQ60_004203 [Tieghemiomyces parasiticus]
MGKAKRTIAKARVNPIGLLAASAAAVGGGMSSQQLPLTAEQGLPLLKKLESADADERAWAATSVSHIFMSNPQYRRKMLATNLVGLLVERLTDDSLTVVSECLGALRNLGTLCDPGIDAQMLKKNITLVLRQLMDKASYFIADLLARPAGSTGPASETVPKGQLTEKLVWEVSENILSLLLTLSEGSQIGLRRVNDTNPLAFVLPFVTTHDARIPAAPRLMAGQCLYTLTANNPFMMRRWMSSGDYLDLLFDGLDAAADPHNHTFKAVPELPVYIGGTLYHTAAFSQRAPANVAPRYEKYRSTLLKVLASHLPKDLDATVQRACELAGRIKLNAASVGDAKAKASVQAVQALTDTENTINALHVVLELLANLFTQAELDKEAKEEQRLAWEARQANGKGGKTSGDHNVMAEDAGDEKSGVGSADERMEAEMEEDDDHGIEEDEDALEGSDLEDLLDVTGGDHADDEDTMDAKLVDLFTRHILAPTLHLAEPITKYLDSLPAEAATPASPQSSDAAASTETDIAGRDALALSTLQSFQSSLNVLHLRALGCLNNFWLVMAEEGPNRAWFNATHGHRDLVYDVWPRLFVMAHRAATPTPIQERFATALEWPLFRSEFLSMALGCLWSLARGSEGEVPVTGDQVATFMSTFTDASGVASAGIKVKCVGILGSIARRRPGHVEENRVVGDFLITHVIEAETRRIIALPSGKSSQFDPAPIESIFQALDAFYEVYGDASYDYDGPVFVQGRYLTRLDALRHDIKRLVKSVDRRTHPELRRRAEEVYLSFPAFIAYKQDEAAQRK